MLILIARTDFKVCEKIQTISLYRFAVLEQTITIRRQNFDVFYLEFSPNLINLVLSSKDNRIWPKMVKTSIVQKNAYMWHLDAKV